VNGENVMEDTKPVPYNCLSECLSALATAHLELPFLNRPTVAGDDEPGIDLHEEVQGSGSEGFHPSAPEAEPAPANSEPRESTTGPPGVNDSRSRPTGQSSEAAAFGATSKAPASPGESRTASAKRADRIPPWAGPYRRSTQISDEELDEDELENSYHCGGPMPPPQHQPASAVAGSKLPEDARPEAIMGDLSDRLSSPGVKEYWTTRLNDAGRMAFEQRAAANVQRSRMFKRLQELSERVSNGDHAAMDEIRLTLDSDEVFWQSYGDAARYTETILVYALAGDIVAVEHSIQRRLEYMKKSLLGENPTLLAQMTVERVIACWLYAMVVDRCAALAVKQGLRLGDLAKAQESAEKRYQTALKSFKLVQKIESPADPQSGKSKAPQSAPQSSVA
jgi:hypothetical protein